MIFTVIFIWRLYWGIVGNKYSRMILVPPLWSLKWWKMLFEQVKYYLFLRKTSPEYAGHNPLAQCAMFFMFTLGSIVIIITGLALYAQAWGADAAGTPGSSGCSCSLATARPFAPRTMRSCISSSSSRLLTST